MPIYQEEVEKKALLKVAELMCLAARTAPKGRGVDRVETLIVYEQDELARLVETMRAFADKQGDACAFFKRDAANLEKSGGPVVIIGSSTGTMGLSGCGYCGFENCSSLTKAGGVCAYVSGDLGIAIGSAVSVASRHNADNRVMFSVGRSAIEMKLFRTDVKIAYGIPLSSSGKNPFFDR